MPITFGLFLLLKKLNYGRAALGLIVVASLAFYGWWDARYLGLLLTSILINYVVGERLVARGPNRALLFVGLAGNLLCLAWFKYAMFAMENINLFLIQPISVPQIILPLGISFFTFLQVAYLVDAHKGKATRHTLVEYMAFVTFFPHLIAMPRFVARAIGWAITMLAVIIAWVFFRSNDVDDALHILTAMAGQGQGGITAPEDIWLLIGGFAFVLLAPNAMQIISHAENGDERKWYSWQPTIKWLGITVILLTISIYIMAFMANRVSEFIYFQF